VNNIFTLYYTPQTSLAKEQLDDLVTPTPPPQHTLGLLPLSNLNSPSTFWFVVLQTYLTKEQLDDLVTLLTKGRVVDRLLDFMPPGKRSMDDFSKHFG
jgi:hypothetical protein